MVLVITGVENGDRDGQNGDGAGQNGDESIGSGVSNASLHACSMLKLHMLLILLL